MDVLQAMAKLHGPLSARMGAEPAAAALDGICELRLVRRMEEAVCWLAHDYDLLEVINGEMAVDSIAESLPVGEMVA